MISSRLTILDLTARAVSIRFAAEHKNSNDALFESSGAYFGTAMRRRGQMTSSRGD